MYDSRTPVSSSDGVAGRNGRAICTGATVLVRLDGTIASWGKTARELFGRSAHEVVGLPFYTLFAGESRDAVDRLWRASPSEPLSISATGRDGSGLLFETEITASRTLAVRDGAAGFVALVRDVTERRAAEEALFACTGARESATALASVRAAIQRWVPIASMSLRAPQTARIRRVNGGFAWSETLQADGRELAVLSVVFSDRRLATPRVIRLVRAVARAIGPSIARTLELEEKSRAIGRLQRIDRLGKELQALIAHDMRTPLAVIAGFAADLRDKWHELPEGARLAGLDAILRNERSLARLVEQDLELALIDAGELQYELTAFDIADEVERIVHDFARTDGTRISLWLDAPLPLVRADQQRNAQVLRNLLSNAVKHSPPGATVEVRAYHRASTVHVSVRDHGPGIAAADVSKLFRKFSRCRAGDRRPVPGTGLGLYLSRRMVEAQGGQIWVETRPGHGATFAYTLPVEARAASGRG